MYTISIITPLDSLVSRSALAIIIFSFFGLGLVVRVPIGLLIELENISFVLMLEQDVVNSYVLKLVPKKVEANILCE